MKILISIFSFVFLAAKIYPRIYQKAKVWKL